MVTARKKVLHVIPAMNSGGAQRLLVDICKELKKRGEYEPAIAILTNEPNRFEEELNGIEVKQFNIPRHVSILALHRPHLQPLQEYVHAFAPDVIHTHIYFSDLIINQIKYTQAKFFSHVHGVTTQYDRAVINTLPTKRQLITRIERYLMLRAYICRTTQILTVSSHYVTYLQSILPEMANCIHLLHNGIVLSEIAPKQSSKISGQIHLVSVGRLEKVKNHELLIAVCVLLKNAGCNFTLDIYGEGDYRTALEHQIATQKLVGYVNLRGFIFNVKETYQKYDLYVHTAINESFGLTLVEAMAAGLPVVCTDGGGNRDIMQDGVNGYLVNERDANILAEKILFLINNPQLYTQMSKAAIATAQQFTIERCVDKLIQHYES